MTTYTIGAGDCMTHPLAQLLLNPFAGAAGLNLISLGFYFTLALIALAILIESINNKQ